jgi:hypothetical protein
LQRADQKRIVADNRPCRFQLFDGTESVKNNRNNCELSHTLPKTFGATSMLKLVFKWKAVRQAAMQISSLSSPMPGMRIAMNMADASGN